MPTLSLARLLISGLVVCAMLGPAQAQQPVVPGHYMFIWTGDSAKKDKDFLAVIDADPQSSSYGHLLTTLATDQQTMLVHHTEYTMPQSGMLFANDHEAGRTFIFDLREPLHPKAGASFTDMAGYMHPHSYLRLPNGHVLATFQRTHSGGHEHAGMSANASEMTGMNSITGGLVEIDDQGKLVRSASSADPAFTNALLTPYSLAILPQFDRIISTNSSMEDNDIFEGVTYQVWRLSDLKLLKTAYFDVGENRYGQISPEEPRVGPDGSVFVQTLGCGIERITGLQNDQPTSRLVYSFPGNWCGVPTIVGHYLVQTVPAIHGLVVLDIANEAQPVEVSRLVLSETYHPHWTAWDAKTQRLVATSGTSTDRTYLLKLDPATGALTVDESFRDIDGKVGFNFAERQWPHGWTGSGAPHGAVFSR